MQCILRKVSHLASIILISALAVIFGMGIDSWIVPAHAQSEGTFLSFRSQPGDYIGGGQSLTFTPIDSTFNAMVSQDNRELAVSVFPPGTFWFLNMVAPAGQQLVPGVYQGATRMPISGAVHTRTGLFRRLSGVQYTDRTIPSLRSRVFTLRLRGALSRNL